MLANVFDITSCFRLSPPWGGRPHVISDIIVNGLFQSTPSVGRATIIVSVCGEVNVISIHALRGRATSFRISPDTTQTISIHALRGEGDKNVVLPLPGKPK